MLTDRSLGPEHLGERWEALGRAPLPFETSHPGLFAVGDVRSGSTKRVAAAVGEGSTPATWASTSTVAATTLPQISGLVVADPPIQPGARRQLLYEAGSGAAVNELGIEDCQECDPYRPLTPVVISDGTVIIADLVNARWISVRDGVPTATPFPADTRIDAVLGGPGDVIYAVTRTGTPPAWDLRLIALDPTDLATVIAEHDIIDNDQIHPPLRLDGNQVLVDDEPFPLVEQSAAPRR